MFPFVAVYVFVVIDVVIVVNFLLCLTLCDIGSFPEGRTFFEVRQHGKMNS